MARLTFTRALSNYYNIRFMKIRLLLLLTICIYTLTSQAQDSKGTAIQFVAYWAKGDVYRFKVTKHKQKWKEDVLQKNDSASYMVTFKVLDSTATGYKISWKFDLSYIESQLPKEMHDKYSKYFPKEILYTTSDVGAFIEIQNWQTISDNMQKFAKLYAEDLAKTAGMDSKEFKEQMASIISIYDSQEAIEQVAYPEIQTFHFALGAELDSKEVLSYEDELFNIFGGDPILCDVKLRVIEHDAEESYCVITEERDINPESLKMLTESMVKKFGTEENDMKDTFKEMEFDVKDRNRYEYFYYPGVPNFIETKRDTKINVSDSKGRSVEITRIELIGE